MNALNECDCMEKFIEKARNAKRKYDLVKIREAFELACESHAGQVRKSGDPYVSHPIAVAEILLDYLMDTDTIVAALLHDVVEDCEVTLEDLTQRFGETVALLVDGVTKVSKVKLVIPGTDLGNDNMQTLTMTEEEQQSENIRKILVSMNKDPRVIIIKLADRIHNMRTLDAFRDEKKVRISLETIAFHAPIAHRMGMSQIKDELENTALRHFDPYAHKDITQDLENYKLRREDSINKITERVTSRLSDIKPVPEIEGRIKGIYSLYKKYYLAGRSINEIYDVYAIRIITETSADCYNILGVIHDIFTPLPGRFKDFIANPKSNGYQSLHTTVLGREKQPFEVQIRTQEMHNTALYGIAAHWRYKLGVEDEGEQNQDRFAIIREMLERQQMGDSPEALASSVKTDLSPDEVHVFTPKGEPRSLPVGSTVVDFAYLIHTHVGHRMKGATVHQKKVGFDYELKTGDIIDIMTSKDSSGPDRSWLNYVKTNAARSKIQNWLKRERLQESISSGRAFVESVLRREGIPLDENAFTQLEELALTRRYATLEDFYAAIGYGAVHTDDAILWIQGRITSPKKQAKKPPPPEKIYTDIHLTVETSTQEEFNEIISRLNKISGIVNVNIKQGESNENKKTNHGSVSD